MSALSLEVHALGAYLIVENFVLLLQTRHKRVLCQSIGPAAVLLVGPFDLLIQCLHICWEQTLELEGFALMDWKGGALVEIRGSKQSRSLDQW